MNIQQIATRSLFCLLAWFTLAVAPTRAQTITHVPLFEFDFGRSLSGAGDVNGDGCADVVLGARVCPFQGIVFGSTEVISGADGSVLYEIPVSDSDEVGRTVSGAGDVNGDGFGDVILGGFGNDINGTDSGSVRVISGIDGSVLHDFQGDSAFDEFGRSVSGAGDVDGDGFDDLIVAAPRADNGGPNSGSVRVFSGVDGSVLYNFDGDSDLGLFGLSVSGAGDVNGDGFDDVIVGGPFGPDINATLGNAQVFSGIDGSVLYSFAGDSNGDRLGLAVSDAGDVNGDGFDDIILGAPRDDNNGSSSGSARVISGEDGSVLYNFDGDGFGDLLGSSVSGAGDLNGDGFDDLIVGAPGTDRVNYTINSYIRVYSGADGSVIYTFNGESVFDAFGSTVSGVGDVNGDGVDDFIAGGSNNSRLFVSQISVPFVLGDVNQDGVVDFADIPSFISVLISGEFQAEADCNEDGEVTFADIPAFIAILIAAA